MRPRDATDGKERAADATVGTALLGSSADGSVVFEKWSKRLVEPPHMTVVFAGMCAGLIATRMQQVSEWPS